MFCGGFKIAAKKQKIPKIQNIPNESIFDLTPVLRKLLTCNNVDQFGLQGMVRRDKLFKS